MDTFSKKIEIDQLITEDALKARLNGLVRLIDWAKADLASYDEQLKEVTNKLKQFAVDSTEAVQAVAETVVEKVEEVAAKVEETVEVVKEEVKKAAPKKAAAKKTAPATEESNK
jgi:gas vesicle protein